MQVDERFFDLAAGWRVEPPVSLVADAVDAQPARLQVLDQPDHARALRRLLEVVVVVIELDVRIGFMGEFERLGDVVVADAVVPRRLAQRAILVDRLVDDVPAMDLSLVATDNGVNVVAHPREQRLAIGRLAIGALKHPRDVCECHTRLWPTTCIFRSRPNCT